MDKLIALHREGWKHRIWTVPALYLLNWLILLDHAVCTLFGFDWRMTISAILEIFSRKKDCKFCDFICDLLDKIDDEHCSQSIRYWKAYRKTDRSIWNIARWENLDA